MLSVYPHHSPPVNRINKQLIIQGAQPCIEKKTLDLFAKEIKIIRNDGSGFC